MRYIKWVFIGVIATIVIVVQSLILLLNSDYGKERLLNIGLSYANEYMNARVDAEKISGNIFTHIHLSDVSLQLDSSRVAHIKNIDLHYSPFYLLRKMVTVDSVRVSGVEVFAYTLADSSWCFSHLHRPLKPDTLLLDTASTQFKVDIKNFVIEDVHIISKTHYSYIPIESKSRVLKGSFYWDANLWRLSLKQFQIHTKTPDLHILDLSFDLKSDNEAFSLSEFNLKTENNHLKSKGIFSNLLSYSANLRGDELDLSETQFALPTINLKVSPSVWFDVNTVNGLTKCKAIVTMGLQQVDCSLDFNQLTDSLFVPQNIVTQVVLKEVVLSDWGLPVDSTLKISATIAAQAMELKTLDDSIRFQLQIDTLNYSFYHITNSSLDGLLVGKYILLNGNVASNLGHLEFKGNARGVGTTNAFWAKGNFSNVKPHDFTLPPLPFSALLNGGFEGSGSVPSLKRLSLDGNIKLSNSLVDRVVVDSALLRFSILSDTIKLSTFDVSTSGLTLKGTAKSTFTGTWDMTAKIVGEVSSFAHIYAEDLPIGAQLELNANISGVRDSLAGFVNGNLSHLKYDSISIAHTRFNGDFDYNAHSGFNADHVDIRSFGLFVNGFNADSLEIQGAFDQSNLHASVQLIQSQKLKAKMVGDINITSGYHISINSLEVTTPYADFYNDLPKINLSLNNQQLSLSGLLLKDKLHPNFSLDANGSLTASGKEDFHLSMKGFDVNILYQAKLTGLQVVHGILNSTLLISGTSQKPKATFYSTIDSLQVGAVSVKQLTTEVTVDQSKAKLDMLLLTYFQDSINLNALAPLRFNLDTASMSFNFPGTLSGRVHSTDVDIAERDYANKALTKMGGLLSFDISFSGLYSNLIYRGSVLLKNGFFRDIKNGINLNNINSSISVDSNKVAIDSLNMGELKSRIKASGFIHFDTAIATGRIKDVDLSLSAKDFNVVKSKERELIISSVLNLKMEDQKPMLTGDIKVVKSNFYLPALLETDYKAASEKPSLLMVARHKMLLAGVDSIKVTAVNISNESSFLKKFTHNMGALIHVDIPKNSWLKSETSKVELFGNVTVVKNGINFIIQGKIEVARGQLTVYGRKFVITAGTMEFQGSENINPLLDITTEYEFRASDGSRKTLKMRITNFLEQPEINYTLDGQVITASNAYSYIVFGKPMNEIGSGEQMDITGAYAADAVSKIVSNQLSQTVGETFSLDIIEINTTENLQSMAFTVGKYITKDIFVTYQKGFGETSSTDYLPDQFTLEYEFVKNLVFRIQSGNSDKNGVDLILKFER